MLKIELYICLWYSCIHTLEEENREARRVERRSARRLRWRSSTRGGGARRRTAALGRMLRLLTQRRLAPGAWIRTSHLAPGPPSTPAQKLQQRINRQIEEARDPVTGRQTVIFQPTEEQAPGLRALLIGVLQDAGADGVPLSRFWQRYRKLYANYEHPQYVKSRPLEGSKNRTSQADRKFSPGPQKPDKTIVLLLRSYGATLQSLLASLPHVDFRRGGREGVVVALKPEFLQMLKEDGTQST